MTTQAPARILRLGTGRAGGPLKLSQGLRGGGIDILELRAELPHERRGMQQVVAGVHGAYPDPGRSRADETDESEGRERGSPHG